MNVAKDEDVAISPAAEGVSHPPVSESFIHVFFKSRGDGLIN